jgi:polyhydroxyalkanoate synthesis regulator phasin|tara:strand:- start:623 stop:742 length:120 start_codon:yes stop_codon:yes gene_type:complete
MNEQDRIKELKSKLALLQRELSARVEALETQMAQVSGSS